MKKEIIFFNQKPPEDKQAIHVWLGKVDLPHEHYLRQILAQYLGPVPLHIAAGNTGKLYLPDVPLHFNLSDSGEWLAIALSWEAPLGIDIEIVRSIEGMEQLILDCFSAREQAYVYAGKEGDASDFRGRFWEIWNKKEACIKALGLGLQDHMNQWDCMGNDWTYVNQVWVSSLSVKHPLSAAIAICL